MTKCTYISRESQKTLGLPEKIYNISHFELHLFKFFCYYMYICRKIIKLCIWSVCTHDLFQTFA